MRTIEIPCELNEPDFWDWARTTIADDANHPAYLTYSMDPCKVVLRFCGAGDRDLVKAASAVAGVVGVIAAGTAAECLTKYARQRYEDQSVIVRYYADGSSTIQIPEASLLPDGVRQAFRSSDAPSATIIASAIDKAIIEEREACARAARTHDRRGDDQWTIGYDNGRLDAAFAIRERE